MKLSDKVIAEIKNDIAMGKLRKGEKIPAEPELMELYHVGRSTIREAIKTLSMSGILKVQQGSGTFVASKVKDESLRQRLRRADFEEINAVRSFFEKEMLVLAIGNRTTADLEQMQSWLAQRKKGIAMNNPKKCADADIGFHLSIARASGNRVLYDLYQNLASVIQDFFTRRDGDVSHFARTQAAHEALTGAIADQDQEAAERILKSILQNNY